MKMIEFVEGTLINADNIVMITNLEKKDGDVQVVLNTGTILNLSGQGAKTARAIFCPNLSEDEEFMQALRDVQVDNKIQ